MVESRRCVFKRDSLPLLQDLIWKVWDGPRSGHFLPTYQIPCRRARGPCEGQTRRRGDGPVGLKVKMKVLWRATEGVFQRPRNVMLPACLSWKWEGRRERQRGRQAHSQNSTFFKWLSQFTYTTICFVYLRQYFFLCLPVLLLFKITLTWNNQNILEEVKLNGYLRFL